VVLDRFDTPTSRYLQERFGEGGTPVGASSFSVACHVVRLPELTLVVDSTYRTRAPGIVPVGERKVRPDPERGFVVEGVLLVTVAAARSDGPGPTDRQVAGGATPRRADPPGQVRTAPVGCMIPTQASLSQRAECGCEPKFPSGFRKYQV